MKVEPPAAPIVSVVSINPVMCDVFPPDPTKPGIPLHVSNSDVRSWRNSVAQLRRCGANLPSVVD